MDKGKNVKKGSRPGVKGFPAFWLAWTGLFCVTAAAVFVWFYLEKRSFVWTEEGLKQDYYGLICFSRWGKEILRQFQETGAVQIPTFTLRMGGGEDLYTALAPCVIGDLFSLPALFVPEKNLLFLQGLMLLLRLWLAGTAFGACCFYMKRKDGGAEGLGKEAAPGPEILAVLVGAMVYVFNGFTMSGIRHPYGLNPLVFFPLLLIGCEQYLRKRKPVLFILMAFVTAVSSFSDFYRMVLMTALYAVWRSVRMNGLRRFGRVLLDGIALSFYGIVGVLLSSFLFLPVGLSALQDWGRAKEGTVPILWPLSYYRNLLDSFLTNGTFAMEESWTCMGFGALAFWCILFVFFQRKRYFDLKAAFAGLTALLLIPMAGYVMDGFSDPANRWMWAFALLVAYMTATAVQEMTGAGSWRDGPAQGAAEQKGDQGKGWFRAMAAALLVFALAIAVCAVWKYTFSRSTALSVIIALFAAAAVLLGRVALLENSQGKPGDGAFAGKVRVRVQAAVLLCALLTAVSAGCFDYSPAESGKVSEYLSRAQIEAQAAEDFAAAAEPPARIAFVFPEEGTFSTDSIPAVLQSVTEYAAKAQAPGEDVFTDPDLHEMGQSLATEKITGRVDLDVPKILCFQFPCTPGWTAYVDGARAELHQAGTMYSALLLGAGSHQIELRYQTPGLRLGAAVSAAALLLVLLFGLIYTLVSLILGRRERRTGAIPEGEFRTDVPEEKEHAEQKGSAGQQEHAGLNRKAELEGRKEKKPENL